MNGYDEDLELVDLDNVSLSTIDSVPLYQNMQQVRAFLVDKVSRVKGSDKYLVEGSGYSVLVDREVVSDWCALHVRALVGKYLIIREGSFGLADESKMKNDFICIS